MCDTGGVGMTLLEMVVKEYLSIVGLLEQNEPIQNNRIIIDRQYFRDLLEKYGYLSFREKTRYYKALNFIIHDKNNYTLPCKDKVTKKTARMVVVNYSTYLLLKQLLNTEMSV